jgi:hypothetical protein
MSGPSVPNITLTFNGEMPLLIKSIRPDANGLCNPGPPVIPWTLDEWNASSGIVGDQHNMVDETTKDDDITYIKKMEKGGDAYQLFSGPAANLPANSTIEYVRLNAYYKYYFNWEGIEPNWAIMAIHPEYGWQPDWAYLLGGGTGWFNLILTETDCYPMVSTPSITLNSNMWGRDYYHTKYWYDRHFVQTDDYLYTSETYTTNPNTSNAWLESEVDDLQFGVKGMILDPGTDGLGMVNALGVNDGGFFFKSDVTVTGWSKSGYPAIPYPTYYEYLTEVDIAYILTFSINKPCTFKLDAADYAKYENWTNSTVLGITLGAYIRGSEDHDNSIHWIWLHDGVRTELGTQTVTTKSPPWQHITLTTSTINSWHKLDPAHNAFGIEVHAVHAGGAIHLTKFNIESITVMSRLGSIRVTQEYLDVAYREEVPDPCRLPKPEWNGIRVNQDIETMALNFWSGNREVYALGRSSKRTILSGTMWDGCTDGITTCEGIISCIRSLAKMKQQITIGGLRYNDLNVDYNIISFDWKQIQEKPNEYEWALELEFKQ